MFSRGDESFGSEGGPLGENATFHRDRFIFKKQRGITRYVGEKTGLCSYDMAERGR